MPQHQMARAGLRQWMSGEVGARITMWAAALELGFLTGLQSTTVGAALIG